MVSCGVGLKTTETLRLRLQTTVLIHLIPYKAMTYNILTAPLRRCQSLKKSQNASKSCSQRPQNACVNRLFQCFSPFLEHAPALQNFST